jgi:predicted Zn-ribbon and HTH transcriptional regulator
MSGRLQERIRQVLREVPDGLTVNEIWAALDIPLDTRSTEVYKALKRMPDVYIDRWTRYPTAAVYVAVEVPANCPKPERQNA